MGSEQRPFSDVLERKSDNQIATWADSILATPDEDRLQMVAEDHSVLDVLGEQIRRLRAALHASARRIVELEAQRDTAMQHTEWRHWWDWSHGPIEAAQRREHEQFMIGRLMERLGDQDGPDGE